MKAAIEENSKSAEVELIEAGGGVFEVTLDGELIFSKKKLGRFPEHSEILQKIQ